MHIGSSNSTIKPEKREILRDAGRKLKVHFNWVFVSELVRNEKGNPDHLVLSTTEREFLQHSKYDLCANYRYRTDGTLHYLDAIDRKLITYRGMVCVHDPQVYSGLNIVERIKIIKVSPANGEFVHDGEVEKLQVSIEQRACVDARRTNSRFEILASDKFLGIDQEISAGRLSIRTAKTIQGKHTIQLIYPIMILCNRKKGNVSFVEKKHSIGGGLMGKPVNASANPA